MVNSLLAKRRAREVEPDAQNAIYFSTKRDNCATTPESEHHSLQQKMERQPYARMFCIRLLKNKNKQTQEKAEGTLPPKEKREHHHQRRGPDDYNSDSFSTTKRPFK